MDARLEDVLQGKEGNYLYPFFWIRDGRTEELPGRIQKVYESGCRAFCVESRTHHDFCGPGWWEDMGVILKEAQKRGMKVWVLDDKHFPTGYANGILEKCHGDKRKWFIREHHVDVAGPLAGSSVLVPMMQEVEEIITAVAYRRAGKEDGLEGPGIDLSEGLKGGGDFLYWDVPVGFYRIFFLIKTRDGGRQDQADYINELSGESARMLIDAVYEPHYTYVGEYFGNTLAGFFSDEPGFYSRHMGHWGYDKGEYNRTVGQPGLALPWDEGLIPRMESYDAVGAGMALNMLPLLWYPCKDLSPVVRLAYMDSVTLLWEENFSMQVGNWCRAHHVTYTGHIIEDMNAHMRIGSGAGHYFRALGGQDISGVDIVLHQVLPGYGHRDAAGLGESGRVDCHFFHYVLPKLAVSLARTEPRMEGRAMCEVFGAYGWAETVSCMKWLIDFLLVRGINCFVPHAFTDRFPDPDCPPHFYAEGNNPQFPGFCKLMRYTNKAAHLLAGARLWTEGAVLYPAEGEWMSSPASRTMDECARVLYDAHIDFDILSIDALGRAKVREKKLWVNGYAHRFLVVPYAEFYPEKLWKILGQFEEEGFPIFRLWENGSGQGAGGEALPGTLVTAGMLAGELAKRSLVHRYMDGMEYLRISRFHREQAVWFMLFWEDIREKAAGVVQLPCAGEFLRLDIMSGKMVRDFTPDGRVEIHLVPYQSELLLFDRFDEAFLGSVPEKDIWEEWMKPGLLWDIGLMEQGKDPDYRLVRKESELFRITGQDAWPHFSGQVRYETVIKLTEAGRWGIDLGEVGVTANLTVNGEDLGMRICPPYRWDISGQAREGENKIVVEVANTLIYRLGKDRCSEFLQVGPSGLLGPVRLYRIESQP